MKKKEAIWIIRSKEKGIERSFYGTQEDAQHEADKIAADTGRICVVV